MSASLPASIPCSSGAEVRQPLVGQTPVALLLLDGASCRCDIPALLAAAGSAGVRGDGCVVMPAGVCDVASGPARCAVRGGGWVAGGAFRVEGGAEQPSVSATQAMQVMEATQVTYRKLLFFTAATVRSLEEEVQ